MGYEYILNIKVEVLQKSLSLSTSFNISMYMPDTIMQRMSLQTPTDGIVRAFVVGGVFTIATICVSMILQNKRDI